MRRAWILLASLTILGGLTACGTDLNGTWAGGGGCDDDTDFEASFLLALQEETEGTWAGDGQVTWTRSESLSSDYDAALSVTLIDGLVTEMVVSDCVAGPVTDILSPTTECGEISNPILDPETEGRLSATWTDLMGEGAECALGLVLFE